MLQINVIRENSESVLKGLKKRNFREAEELIYKALELDTNRKREQQKADDLKAESNADSKKIGELIKAGKTEEATNLKGKVTSAKGHLRIWEANLLVFEKELQEVLYKIPNVPAENVPAGKTPEENLTVHEWGAMPSLSADAQPHWDLIKKYDIIDFDLGNKIAGAGFPVYKGKGAKLQRALINFFLNEASLQGYIEIQPLASFTTMGG